MREVLAQCNCRHTSMRHQLISITGGAAAQSDTVITGNKSLYTALEAGTMYIY